jgi:hypothetical protein
MSDRQPHTSALYRWARLLGDVEAIRHPHKIPKRIANKLVRQEHLRRLWR